MTSEYREWSMGGHSCIESCYYRKWLEGGGTYDWTEEEKEQTIESYLKLHSLIDTGDKNEVLKFINDRGNINKHTFYVVYHQFTLPLPPMSPVAAAARSGKVDIMKELISLGFDTNDECMNQSWEWRCPLHLAAEKNQTEAVKCLLEDYKVEIDSKEGDGKTALGRCTIYSEKIDTAKLLVESGASVNISCDEEGNTPLLYTAFHNKVEIGKYLISNGGDVNLKNFDNETLLMTAFDQLCSPELITAIIDAGADVNMPTGDGSYPMHYAVTDLPDDEFYPTLNHVKHLIAKGAGVNCVNSFSETPLYLSCEHVFPELFHYLLVDMNACMNRAVSSQGFSVFSLAFLCRQEVLIDVMLACGYDPSTEGCVFHYDRNDIKNDSEEWNEYVEKLKKSASSPLSLKMLSIGRIRSLLCSGPRFKLDLIRLGLPWSIVDDMLPRPSHFDIYSYDEMMSWFQSEF